VFEIYKNKYVNRFASVCGKMKNKDKRWNGILIINVYEMCLTIMRVIWTFSGVWFLYNVSTRTNSLYYVPGISSKPKHDVK